MTIQVHDALELIATYKGMQAALNDSYNAVCDLAGVSSAYDAAMDHGEQLGRMWSALVSLLSELSEEDTRELLTELEKMAA